MTYQVLARKWRPKNFSEIIGQKHIVQAIMRSFSLNKIHHAYILSGTRGVGKTTIARLFAKGLNCLQKPMSQETIICCNQCKHCQEIESGYFIDLIEIDAASRTKVEDTREFLDGVQYLPSKGNFKIYLIDEVHMLSRHSFNALLKTLEEPPQHVKFILITTEYQKLPNTILSRCIQFHFKPLDTSEIITQLKNIFHKENILITDMSALESLAHASKGSMRDALSLSEQAIILGDNKITSDAINNMFGILNVEYPLCLIENLIHHDIHKIMSQIDDYSVLGVNWDYILVEMLTILQKMALGQFSSSFFNKQNDNNTISHIEKRIYQLSIQIKPEDIQLYYQILLLGRRELPYAPSDKMGMEMIMLRALAFYPTEINTTNKNHTMPSNNTAPDDIPNLLINKPNNTTKQITTITNSHTISTQKKYDLSIKKPTICNNIHTSYPIIKQLQYNNKTQLATITSHTTNNIINHSTLNLLKARNKLLINHRYNTLNKIKNSNDIHDFQKKSINILKRFSNINTTTITNKHSNIHDKYHNILNYLININVINNNIINTHSFCHNTSKIIQSVLQEAIQNNQWIRQIYQLSLSKLARKLIINTWKEDTISTNEIFLHIHYEHRHLNSKVLRDSIQHALSKYMELPITLHIQEDNNLLKQTPIEYIYILYEKKISKIKSECLHDPSIKMIKKFFNTEIDENNIL